MIQFTERGVDINLNEIYFLAIRLQCTLLNEVGDAVDCGIFLILVGTKFKLHIDSEESAESLPEAGAKTSQKGLHDIERRLICFAVNEFQHHFALSLSHCLHHRLITLKNILLKAF